MKREVVISDDHVDLRLVYALIQGIYGAFAVSVVIRVGVTVQSIATTTAARPYKWRVFILSVLRRTITPAVEFTHPAPPPACALAVGLMCWMHGFDG
jgi:hypothetical protein